MAIISALGGVAVSIIDAVVFFKNIRTSSEKLRSTFIMLQLIFGAILFLTGNGFGALLSRLLIALFCKIFPNGGIIKVVWGISVISNIVSVVMAVIHIFVG